MWEKTDYSDHTGEDYWIALRRDLLNLLSDDEHPITTLSNAAAFLFNVLDDINWAGFYLCHDNKLILGPFGGKPACTSIAIGSGVCGTAIQERRTIVVGDVNLFPGHIVCDSDSRSEIVIPLIINGESIGVLDIDSPIVERFSEDDACGLEDIANVILQKINLPILQS